MVVKSFVNNNYNRKEKYDSNENKKYFVYFDSFNDDAFNKFGIIRKSDKNECKI